LNSRFFFASDVAVAFDAAQLHLSTAPQPKKHSQDSTFVWQQVSTTFFVTRWTVRAAGGSAGSANRRGFARAALPFGA